MIVIRSDVTIVLSRLTPTLERRFGFHPADRLV